MENFELARLGWQMIVTVIGGLAWLGVFLYRRTTHNAGEVTGLKERVKVLEATAASNVELVRVTTELKGAVDNLRTESRAGMKSLRGDIRGYSVRIEQAFEAVKDLEKGKKDK